MSDSASDRRATSDAAPPRPITPLLIPAIALAVGIALSEACGPVSQFASWMAAAVPLLAAGAAAWPLVRRRDRAIERLGGLIGAFARRSSLSICLLVVATAVGFVRHQTATHLPPDHMAHAVTPERVITRIAGTIVSEPVSQPPERRNPFAAVEPRPRTRFVLDARELRTSDPPTPVRGNVRVTVQTDRLDARLGDRVIVTGHISAPVGRRNPGDSDWAQLNRTAGIHAALFVEDPALLEVQPRGGSWLMGALAWLRAGAHGLLLEPGAQVERDETTRLLDAMLIGQRSAVTRALDAAFVRTGSVHILSVSGSHLGIVALATALLTRRFLRRSARTTAVVTALVMLSYAALAEPNAPVLRSVCMGLLACAAVVVARPFSVLNWLAASALTILLIDPLALFQAGFQLSFTQVAALLLIVPPIYRRLTEPRGAYGSPLQSDVHTLAAFIRRWVWRTLVGWSVVAIVAWLISLPLVLLHFGLFTPFGAFQSILLSPLFALAIILGYVTLVVGVVARPLAALLAILLARFMSLLLACVKLLAAWPGTLVETPAPPGALVLATYVVLAGWIALRRLAPRTEGGSASAVTPDGQPALTPGGTAARTGARRRAHYGLLIALTAVTVGWVWWGVGPWLIPQRDWALHVLSVGDGSAAIVVSPQRAAAVVDCGTLQNFDAGETMRRALHTLRVRQVSFASVSHDDYDHFSGLPALLDGYAVQRLLTNPFLRVAAESEKPTRALLDDIGRRGRSFELASVGQSWRLDDARIDVLWPPPELNPPAIGNATSLVLRITAGDRRLLLPGDIEQRAMSALLEEHNAGRLDLRADVLVAPHHGSTAPRCSAEFYAAVRPSVVIVSTNHPRPKLVDLLRRTLGDECRVISTRDVGAVTIRISDVGGVSVETPYVRRD